MSVGVSEGEGVWRRSHSFWELHFCAREDAMNLLIILHICHSSCAWM